MPYILKAEQLETQANKTLIIDENSTYDQYPSAKAVYDALSGFTPSSDTFDVDQSYSPESQNAQSGIAVAEALENTVGRKTAEGGEIFNDYDNNEASGQISQAQGTGTKAKHKGSSTSGLNTETGTDNQTVVGKYNRVVSDALFVVGNGTDNDSRKNAFEVKANGDVKIDSALILTDSTSGKEYKIYINDGKLQLEEVN